MAKVLNPVLSTQASGMVSGLIVANSRGQDIMRRYLRPTNRWRNVQPNNRALTGFLSRQWQSLSSANRALWDAYADEHPKLNVFGQSFKATGYNWYVALNHQAVRLGTATALQLTPPLDPPAATLLTLAVTQGTNPGEIDLDWTVGGTGDAADFVEVSMCGPFGSPAINYVESKWKYLETVAGNLTTDTVDGLVEGAWYWFKARYTDQYGQVSAWLRGQQTPTPTP